MRPKARAGGFSARESPGINDPATAKTNEKWSPVRRHYFRGWLSVAHAFGSTTSIPRYFIQNASWVRYSLAETGVPSLWRTDIAMLQYSDADRASRLHV